MNIGVLTQWVAPQLVDRVVAGSTRPDRVPSALPLRFMVYYMLALALFSRDSYEDVMDNLVSGVAQLAPNAPAKSSIFAARKRLGAEAMREVFRQVAGQVAVPGTPGAFWRGRLVMAIDGFMLDVADSAENREYFGSTGSRDAGAPFPKARVVTLLEAATRAVRGAAVGQSGFGERELTAQLVPLTGPDMVVIMDRGFPGCALIEKFNTAGSAVVIRAASRIATRAQQVLPDGSYLAQMRPEWGNGGEPVTVRVIEYQVDHGQAVRLLTNLLDPDHAPARELAALYSQRWESESSNRQVKTYQQGPHAVLRSGSPALVLQEIWAYLTVNHCLSRPAGLIAERRDIDPDGLCFTKLLKEARRSVIRQSTDTIAKAAKTAQAIADDLRRYRHTVVPGRSAPRTLKRTLKRFTSRGATPGRAVTTRVPPRVITLRPMLS